MKTFNQWWEAEGRLKSMPALDEPPQHGYAAHNGWDAALEALKGELPVREVMSIPPAVFEALFANRHDIAGLDATARLAAHLGKLASERQNEVLKGQSQRFEEEAIRT